MPCPISCTLAFDTCIYRLTSAVVAVLAQFRILTEDGGLRTFTNTSGAKIAVWHCGMCHTCCRLISALLVCPHCEHESWHCNMSASHAQYQTDTMQDGPREMIGLRTGTIPSLAYIRGSGSCMCTNSDGLSRKVPSLVGFRGFTSMT